MINKNKERLVKILNKVATHGVVTHKDTVLYNNVFYHYYKFKDNYTYMIDVSSTV